MEIVINITEEDYINIKNAINSLIENGVERASMSKICLAILDGTPLPKGHGRIGDLDSVMSDISTSINEMTNIGVAVDGDYLWAKLNDAIDNAQTLIGAESEE